MTISMYTFWQCLAGEHFTCPILQAGERLYECSCGCHVNAHMSLGDSCVRDLAVACPHNGACVGCRA